MTNLLCHRFKEKILKMTITDLIKEGTAAAVKELYDYEIEPAKVTMNVTRKEFEGDYSVVVFPYTKSAKKKPEQIGEEVGQFLVEKYDDLTNFNVIKGFLNLQVNDSYWNQYLEEIIQKDSIGKFPRNGKKIMIEFSSPNTNKPLHLGHIRNILLGWSSYKMYDALGYDVIRTQIVNDRGIAICESMLAWQLFGNGQTPEDAGEKSDHYVGHWYVEFEKHFQTEYKAWQSSVDGQYVYSTKRTKDKEGNPQEETVFFKKYKNTYFNEQSKLGKAAKELLLKWEANAPDARALWKKMNNWVYEGFDVTYKNLGVEFDQLYHESNTYLFGKTMIEEGLKNDIFYKKEDGSVWIDLEDAKLDHKLVLRSDGTSVYMTQDLGTAQIRYNDHGTEQMVYVVADEQDYHFKVLFEIMKRLSAPYAAGMYHLSYGMIDLTTGKMKSREGTIVDADDLMETVISEARNNGEERGELEDLSKEEREDIYRKIGLAALKYFIIKVNAKKRMVFNPAESVDVQGDTGPYIQYTVVRSKSVQRKAGDFDTSASVNYKNLNDSERSIIGQIYRLNETIELAAKNFDPSILANYCYDLAKSYHKFFHDHSILKAETEEAKAFRLKLNQAIGKTLTFAMGLLGIEMPERM